MFDQHAVNVDLSHQAQRFPLGSDSDAAIVRSLNGTGDLLQRFLQLGYLLLQAIFSCDNLPQIVQGFVRFQRLDPIR